MRVAFMHPTYWPEVRRGSERLIHDLAVRLTRRGHEITILTTHPGPASVSEEEGVRVIRSRRAPSLRPLRWYEDHIANVPTQFWRLWRGEYELAHAFFPADAWAAAKASQRSVGPPFVFSLHGIPIRKYLVERRYRIEQLRESIAAAAALTVLSEAAAEPVRRYLLHEPEVVGGGVVTSDFAVDAARAERPTLICAASLADSRKRGALLLEAFALLRGRRPDLELLLVTPRDPQLASRPGGELELPEGARWVEADETPTLARLYAGAWASVLPSVDEAFGLVLVESLAAGTPVAAADSGACPEIVSSERVGRLFEPDRPEDLARAIEETLELGRDPATAGACREHAARHEIDAVLDRFEKLYERALATGRSTAAAR